MNPAGRGRGRGFLTNVSRCSSALPPSETSLASSVIGSISDVTLVEQFEDASVLSETTDPMPDVTRSRGVHSTPRDVRPESSLSVDSVSSSIMSLRLRPFPVRPGHGINGREIALYANFHPLRFDPTNCKVHHYDVDIIELRGDDGEEDEVIFDCDINSKRYKKLRLRVNMEIIQEMTKQFSTPGELFDGIIPVFDGIKNMYTAKEIVLIAEDPTVPQKRRIKIDINGHQTTYVIRLSKASEIDLNQLNEFYKSKLDEPPQDCLQALDIILRHGPTYCGVPINNSIYLSHTVDKSRLSISKGQQVAFGYFQAVRAVSQAPLLVVDRTATLFYEAKSVLAYVASLVDPGTALNASTFKSAPLMNRIEHNLKGLEVKVNHLTYKRKYKVKRLTAESANGLIIDYTQMGEDGIALPVERIPVAQFYSRHHRKQLKHPDFPCIVSGSAARPCYIPIELCELVGDQPVKAMSPEGTAEMIRVAASQTPVQRFQVIAKSIKLSKETSKPYLAEFGIQIRSNPLKINGRVLEPPALSCQGGTLTPFEGQWSVGHQKKLLQPISLTKTEWTIISFVKGFQSTTLISKMKHNGTQLGFVFADPALVVTRDYVPGCIVELFKNLKSRVPNCKLVVFVLFQSHDLYREIKLTGDCFDKIATQCLHQRNMKRFGEDNYIKNVLLKINSKLGGVSSALHPNSQLPSFFTHDKIMTVGIDFTHPSPGEQLATSICAVVASADRFQSRWLSSVRVHKGNAQVELLDQLENMMTAIFSAYVDKNGFFPEKVIIYRDGVSESQFRKVLEVEGPAFLRGMKNVRNKYKHIKCNKPKFTLVIVQKNHRTRFIPQFPKDGVGRALNIPPGTCVDQDVIHITDFDFYLASHEGIQGTSRPSHYYVLLDDNNFEADELQAITYALAHCFVRCTRSISVPAPVAYANLVAYRARVHYLGALSCKFNYEKFAEQDSIGGVMYYV
ncbi:Protein argonaute-2 [Halotydeus destructor]|nr:Protein argonaute-2 [Halotydeus destructor]